MTLTHLHCSWASSSTSWSAACARSRQLPPFLHSQHCSVGLLLGAAQVRGADRTYCPAAQLMVPAQSLVVVWPIPLCSAMECCSVVSGGCTRRFGSPACAEASVLCSSLFSPVCTSHCAARLGSLLDIALGDSDPPPALWLVTHPLLFPLPLPFSSTAQSSTGCCIGRSPSFPSSTTGGPSRQERSERDSLR